MTANKTQTQAQTNDERLAAFVQTNARRHPTRPHIVGVPWDEVVIGLRPWTPEEVEDAANRAFDRGLIVEMVLGWLAPAGIAADVVEA